MRHDKEIVNILREKIKNFDKEIFDRDLLLIQMIFTELRNRARRQGKGGIVKHLKLEEEAILSSYIKGKINVLEINYD